MSEKEIAKEIYHVFLVLVALFGILFFVFLNMPNDVCRQYDG
ncbi:MAG: hypothetical protein WC375_06105 [Methanomassiliicoccales archaeon]|jgi:hypothetical protein